MGIVDCSPPSALSRSPSNALTHRVTKELSASGYQGTSRCQLPQSTAPFDCHAESSTACEVLSTHPAIVRVVDYRTHATELSLLLSQFHSLSEQPPTCRRVHLVGFYNHAQISGDLLTLIDDCVLNKVVQDSYPVDPFWISHFKFDIGA